MDDPALPLRIFLVVIDDSEEMRVALRYAALRARRTGGRVALLYVIEPSDLQQWMAVESLMREERREEAEALLQRLAGEAGELCGTMPIVYIREGRRRDELLALLEEEPSISILVLAAGTGQEGPGPLVTQLVGKMASRMRVPVTVVPGNLTDEQIAALT
jgi:nucleotide-binding universal stress UspA family protein